MLDTRELYALATRRPGFALALVEALGKVGEALSARRALAVGRGGWVVRQEAFFRRFRW